jgi:very-short-patch-repair endonuclease
MTTKIFPKSHQPLNPPRSPLVRGEGLGFLAYNPKLAELARANRKNPTAAERKIWNEVLRLRQFADHKFLRQKPIDDFVVDFYCSSLKLVIEIDGDSHAESVEYDAARTQTLGNHGLTVIRYTNHDVLHNISGVYDDLVRYVSAMKRTTDSE